MPGSGVPAIVAVPSLLSVNVTPAGSVPVRVIAMPGFRGKPVVVTVNVWPARAGANVALFALVIAGAWFTVSVNDCCGEELTTFVAVNVIAYVPPVPAAGVPLSVPVPSPLSTKVRLRGSGTPPRAIDGAGKPVVVT